MRYQYFVTTNNDLYYNNDKKCFVLTLIDFRSILKAGN